MVFTAYSHLSGPSGLSAEYTFPYAFAHGDRLMAVEQTEDENFY